MIPSWVPQSFIADDNILRYIDQTTGQVTRVSGTQRGIRQTLTGASGGVEVLQNVQAFTVVGLDGDFDGTYRRCWRSDHAYQPADGSGPWSLGRRSPPSCRWGCRRPRLSCRASRTFVGGFVPGLYDTFITDIVRDETTVILTADIQSTFLSASAMMSAFSGGDNRIHDGNGHGRCGWST